MGLDHWTSGNYNYDDGNHVGYTIGYVDTSNGERIVLAAIRGSAGEIQDLGPDWRSNLFNVGPDSEHRHAGFNTAASEIYTILRRYVDVSADNVRVVITGHSRGAAVGNLLAADLIGKSGMDPAHVIAYNFACPNTVTHNQHNGINCPNVFNICNTYDIVPKVPMDDWIFDSYSPFTLMNMLQTLNGSTSWHKYGNNVEFTSGRDLFAEYTIFTVGNFFAQLGRNHEMTMYINWASRQYYN